MGWIGSLDAAIAIPAAAVRIAISKRVFMVKSPCTLRNNFHFMCDYCMKRTGDPDAGQVPKLIIPCLVSMGSGLALQHDIVFVDPFNVRPCPVNLPELQCKT